jgi:hypothetical protein
MKFDRRGTVCNLDQSTVTPRTGQDDLKRFPVESSRSGTEAKRTPVISGGNQLGVRLQWFNQLEVCLGENVRNVDPSEVPVASASSMRQIYDAIVIKIKMFADIK